MMCGFVLGLGFWFGGAGAGAGVFWCGFESDVEAFLRFLEVVDVELGILRVLRGLRGLRGLSEDGEDGKDGGLLIRFCRLCFDGCFGRCGCSSSFVVMYISDEMSNGISPFVVMTSS